jgi:hypothetical protein
MLIGKLREFFGIILVPAYINVSLIAIMYQEGCSDVNIQVPVAL